MPPKPDLDSLRQLQGEIEAFLRSLDHPVVVEDEVELFDLTAAEWRLRLEFGKLLLEVWNPARSIARRVEDIAYRDRKCLGIFVRKPGGRETGTLEFRALERAERAERTSERARSRQQLLGILKREFPCWRFERISQRSDREHSFSTWYTRGWARQGGKAWAFLGLSEADTPAAADAVLAFGLIWLEWLRGRSERVTIPGLKLFLPSEAVDLTAHRAAYLDRRAVQVEIFEWKTGQLRPIDLKDFGQSLKALTGEVLTGIKEEIPPEWAHEDLERIEGHLMKVQKNADKFVEQIRRRLA